VGVGVGIGVGGSIDVCAPFQMGSCTRGSSCPLLHVSGNAGLDGRNRSGLGLGIGRGRGRGRGRGSLIGAPSVEQPTNIGNSNSTVANTRPVQSHKDKKTIAFFKQIEKLEWRHARTTEDKFGFWSPAIRIRDLSPLTTREEASAVLNNFNRITRYVIAITLIY
jgi:hypothetical protein